MSEITVDIEKMVMEECAKRGIPEDLIHDVHAIALKAAHIPLERLGGQA